MTQEPLDQLLRRCASKEYSFDVRLHEDGPRLVDGNKQYPLKDIIRHADGEAHKECSVEDAYVALHRLRYTLHIMGDASAVEDCDAIGSVLTSLYDALLQQPRVVSVIKNENNLQIPLSAPLALIGDYPHASSFIFSMQSEASGDEKLDIVDGLVDRWVEKKGHIAVYRVLGIPSVLLYSPSGLKKMLRAKFGEIQMHIDRAGLKYYPLLLPEL